MGWAAGTVSTRWHFCWARGDLGSDSIIEASEITSCNLLTGRVGTPGTASALRVTQVSSGEPGFTQSQRHIPRELKIHM